MKVTFPHMGGTYAATKAFLEDLGIEVIVPPLCNSKTLEIGVKNSPETICLPLKLNIGNFIQSIEKGADTILIAGSCGPCRFGYYGVIEKEILKDLGYDVNLIVIDPPLEDMKSFMYKIKTITGGNSPKAALKAFFKGYNISKQLDGMDKMMFRIRPREKVAGSVKDIHNYYLNNINKFHGSDQISGFIKDIKEQLEKVEIDEEVKPLRIGIIGEIYTVIEPFVNLYIEEKLGNLKVKRCHCMKELLDTVKLEMSDYMVYGKILMLIFLGTIIVTYIIHKLLIEQRWAKYIPGFLMLIFGLFSLTRIDISSNDFLNDNSLIGFIIGMAGGLATLLFGLILGVYNKPKKKKKPKSDVKEEQ